ncbi:hypothetical protein N9A45_00580 [bacterium]|nr:hypothetical protein [bacterium]
MSSEFHCVLRNDVDVQAVHGMLRQHAIIYSPPYDIQSLMAPFLAPSGRRAHVIIHHSSRNVSVVDTDIRYHVLQTAVHAFQNHRLHMPSEQVRPMLRQDLSEPSRPSRREASVDTGKTCSVCMEKIMRPDVHCLPCAHVFHRACIRRWFQQSTSCPVCRMDST